MEQKSPSFMNTIKKRKGLIAIACIVVIAVVAFPLYNMFFSASSEQYISEVEAKAIALEHAGIAEADATFIRVQLDRGIIRSVYEVEFYSDNIEFDYEIDAVSGKILEFDRDIEDYSILNDNNSGTTNETGQYISESEAKAIALEHARILETDATFVKVNLDNERGRTVYGIEFYSGNTEFDYEIDALTGEILEYDHEIENYTIPTNNNDQYIGEEAAKAIALTDAGYTESEVRRLQVRLERENNIMVYEVEFNVGRTEYGYEIDAISGAIIQKDIDHNN